MEGERYGALRRQMPPPPGTRRAAMMEPMSQGFWPEASRQPGHVVPSLSLLVLADTTTDGVDSSTLRFLAAAALYSRKLDEEKVRKREEEEEELKRIRHIPLNQLTPLQKQKLGCWLHKEKEKKKAKAAVGILPSTSSSSSGFSRKRKQKKRKRTYATLLGSTVDTCLCQSSRLSGSISHFFFVKRWITDPEVDSRLSGVSASHLFFASPEEYMIWIFLLVFLWVMTSGLSPYSVLSLVRQRIHALRQSI